MKILVLVLSLAAVAWSAPSLGSPLLKFANDGRSFSYSYQTPAVVSHYVQPAVVQEYRSVQPHLNSLVVGPAVTYTYSGVAPSVKNIVPANIQISTDGFVLDTPEVAQARAEHLARLAEENARAGISVSKIEDEDTVEVGPPVQGVRTVEPANIQVSSDGHVIDTPEVSQAKAEHFARYNAEAANAAANPDVEPVNNNVFSYRFAQPINVVEPARYVQPFTYLQTAPIVKSYETANIQLSADGHVLDTPEVAHAKAAHFARYNEEAAKAAASPDVDQYNNADQYNNVVTYNYVQPASHFVQPAQVYQYAPIAKAVEVADVKVGADGHLLDTPEVAQAKAAHFAQYSAEAANAIAAGGDQSDYADTASSPNDAVSVVATRIGVTPLKPEDAPADIKVSADGFVLDTPEVAQAKSVHLAQLAVAGETYDDGSSSHGSTFYTAAVPSYVAYTSPAVAYTGTPYAYSAPAAIHQKWVGPEADIKVGSDGFVIDTPEVQQARAEHLSTRSALLANAGNSEWVGASGRYAQVSGSQYIQDTPEVSAARAEHLAAYAQEAAKATTVESFRQNYGQLTYSAPIVRTSGLAYSYSTPFRFLNFRYAPAAPVAFTHDGQYLLDTPEVAAAKAEHFAAHARAIHH